MSKGIGWHSGAELPPLHKKVWTDDDGIVHRTKMSDWMLVKNDSCDPEYTGPVVVARYEHEDGCFSGWMTASGKCDTVYRWHKIPADRSAEREKGGVIE